jgi:RNA polymerase sigma factor for flagellar operon FliA
MMMTTPTSSQLVDELWAEYIHLHSRSCRDRLIDEYLPLVRRIAFKLHTRLPASVQVDDLIQNGTIGLISAVESFEPSRGFAFPTFAGRRIFGAMIDGLRELSDCSRGMISQAKKFAEATCSLEAELGRPPSDEETAAHLGLDQEEYATSVLYRYVETASLDTPILLGGQQFMSLGKMIVDENPGDVFSRIGAEEVVNCVLKYQQLTDAIILRCKFLDGMTIENVATCVGLSEAGVFYRLRAIVRNVRIRLSN